MPPSTIDRDLQRLETDLKQLEAEYNMFFSGRLPKPPWETRARVEALVKQYDRAHIVNTGDRFRFLTLQSRFAAFVDLWDRGLRAREEGRPGPFAKQRSTREPEKKGPEDRILHVSSFRDPVREIDKLTELYESLAEARRDVGEDAPPFHKFAELVKTQVRKIRQNGPSEVAFRVAVKDGKVSFTARGLKGARDDE
ncbi:MAG TPA: MXAN_5187 C-terminal domain-containing protein [Thermoanaerobaculia bacterium]|nr:MXAN_5187 C-terminal domain-containing protein [Thermoanaerobaculia bacterium]